MNKGETHDHPQVGNRMIGFRYRSQHTQLPESSPHHPKAGQTFLPSCSQAQQTFSPLSTTMLNCFSCYLHDSQTFSLVIHILTSNVLPIHLYVLPHYPRAYQFSSIPNKSLLRQSIARNQREMLDLLGLNQNAFKTFS